MWPATRLLVARGEEEAGGAGRHGQIGQAQGSTGLVRLATAGPATDPKTEQSLEVPAGSPPDASVGVGYQAKGRGGKARGERFDRQRSPR
jgi:hypothetical protein